MKPYHWLLVDDFGNEIFLEGEYGSLTVDAAYDFYVSGNAAGFYLVGNAAYSKGE